MIINKKIKETLKEISDQTNKYMNTPNKEYKYLLRLLKVFKNSFTEQEQIFILKNILEQINYRNIITDPDNIAQIYNMKLKTVTYVFLLTIIIIFIVAILFKTNEHLNRLIDIMGNILLLLSL